MINFYQKHKKPILIVGAFIIFVILAVTVIDGDYTQITDALNN